MRIFKKYMSAHYKSPASKKELRQRLIGLGEKSTRKSYFPELQKYLAELERFRALVDQTGDAIFLVDADTTHFIDLNETGVKQLGYSLEELKDISYTDIFSMQGGMCALSSTAEEVANEKTTAVFQCEIKTKFGMNVPVEVDIRPATLDKHDYIIIVSRDISVQKAAEAEKEKLEDQLRQSLKMEAVGTLAGGISHDFNNLIQGIYGFTEILLWKKDKDDPEFKKLIAIQDACARAKELIKQLLLFSRKAETQRKPIDLNRSIEQTRRILEHTIPKMINIAVHLNSPLWQINADEIMMEQILLNLATNAADAMPNGGKLTIETRNVAFGRDYDFGQSVAEAGKYVLLSVSDTGYGMEPETINKIFEPFFTTKVIGKGTGLGLASVYGIVKSHKGHITCSSKVGAGTTFDIYLPAIEVESGDEKKRVESGKSQGGNETILIVDDEEMIRDFAAQALENVGYKVVTVSSGEDALAMYADDSRSFDLVVLDINMPGMGGHHCLRELIRLDPEVKIIVASGYSRSGLIKDTLKKGAVGFLDKPYRLEELYRKTREALDLVKQH